MKFKTWIVLAVMAALSACSTSDSKLIGKWAFPGGSRMFEFKSDGTMTELSRMRSITIKGSGNWEATRDTLTWTETTVEIVSAQSDVPEVQQANSRLAETFKKPHRWLYTMPDMNTLKLTGADGTILPLVRVPGD
jgi:hypothetical protein